MNLTTAGIALPQPQDASLPVVRTDAHGGALHDQSVLDLFMAEHDDDWLYRSQLDRHYRPWPAEDKNGYLAGSYMLDSLTPSDYRGVEEAKRAGKKNDNDVMLAYGDEIAMVRTALVLAGINTLANSNSNGSITAWHQSLPNPNTNYITSLGQHIGLPSQNIDLTSSPEVAWWFATHSWGGTYLSGEGIIYRISKSALEQAISSYNQQNLSQTGAELIDIGSSTYTVPIELTPRPVAQAGLTVFGLEVGEILLNVILNNGITAYVFQRDHTAHPRSTASIQPLPDPLATFIAQAHNNVWNSVWQNTVKDICLRFHIAMVPDITNLRIKTAALYGYAGLKKLRP